MHEMKEQCDQENFMQLRLNKANEDMYVARRPTIFHEQSLCLKKQDT